MAEPLEIEPAEGSAGDDIAPELLRRAFGTFTTGVTVIGARSEDGRLVGMTANSFTSVSLHPPLVLFCPARSLAAFDVYSTARHFSVSVLPAHGEASSNRFARTNTAKWESEPHRVGKTGAPLLLGALASFECEVVARHDGGDHLIVVGRVAYLQATETGEPLVFFRSRYRALDSQTRLVAPVSDPWFVVWE
ncbi:MAG: flavin reductase family protein [Burkholderiales bacterium]|nr:flavin reductase family protein [Burkholderiales bacterium]